MVKEELSHTAHTSLLAMRPFTHGFVGRTATAVDGDVVWACATHDGASADTKTALERTSLEVIAKHSALAAGVYDMPLPDVQRVVTLVKTPAYLPSPLYDATPLPSERVASYSGCSSDRPRQRDPDGPRVVFGAVVPIPEAGGPSAKDCASWLDALANAFERTYGGVADVLARERALDLAAFGRRVRASAADLRPSGAADASSASLAATRAKMDQVRITMVDNIARVVERGEKLDDVLAKSDGLRSTAASFQRTATRLRKKLFWANCKTLVFAVVFVAAASAVIFLAACRGVACVSRR